LESGQRSTASVCQKSFDRFPGAGSCVFYHWMDSPWPMGCKPGVLPVACRSGRRRRRVILVSSANQPPILCNMVFHGLLHRIRHGEPFDGHFLLCCCDRNRADTASFGKAHFFQRLQQNSHIILERRPSPTTAFAVLQTILSRTVAICWISLARFVQNQPYSCRWRAVKLKQKRAVKLQFSRKSNVLGWAICCWFG